MGGCGCEIVTREVNVQRGICPSSIVVAHVQYARKLTLVAGDRECDACV